MPKASIYGLSMIVPEKRKLTPDAAVKWLQGGHQAVMSVVEIGGIAPIDEGGFSPYYVLSCDVKQMMEACGEALSTGKSVRLDPLAGTEVSHADAAKGLAALAEAVSGEDHGSSAVGMLLRWARQRIEWQQEAEATATN